MNIFVEYAVTLCSILISVTVIIYMT